MSNRHKLHMGHIDNMLKSHEVFMCQEAQGVFDSKPLKYRCIYVRRLLLKYLTIIYTKPLYIYIN